MQCTRANDVTYEAAMHRQYHNLPSPPLSHTHSLNNAQTPFTTMLTHITLLSYNGRRRTNRRRISRKPLTDNNATKPYT